MEQSRADELLYYIGDDFPLLGDPKFKPPTLPETRMIPKAVVRSTPAFRFNEFFIASLMS